MGCVPIPLDTTPALHRRIETLDLSNSVLQDKLDRQNSAHKARILDYTDGLNGLNDQLRAAETDARDRKRFEKYLRVRNGRIEKLKKVAREKKCRCKEVREEILLGKVEEEQGAKEMLEKLEKEIGMKKVDSVISSEGRGRRSLN